MMKSMINGTSEIRRLKECKYLELCINKGGCEKCNGDKIYKAQQWLGRLGNSRSS